MRPGEKNFGEEDCGLVLLDDFNCGLGVKGVGERTKTILGTVRGKHDCLGDFNFLADSICEFKSRSVSVVQ